MLATAEGVVSGRSCWADECHYILRRFRVLGLAEEVEYADQSGLNGQACIVPRHECNYEENRGGVRINVGLYASRWDGSDMIHLIDPSPRL